MTATNRRSGVPLGDFFGTAPGINYYKSLATGMTDQGCYAYWYMPFAKRAIVELRQRGHGAARVEFRTGSRPTPATL